MYSRYFNITGPISGYSRRMSFRSIILRLILSLSVLLNGSGYAMATTHAQMGAMGHSGQHSIEHRAVRAHAPCHADMHGASVETDKASALPTKARQGMSDCCKSGPCACACAYGAQTTPPALVLGHVMGTFRAAMRPMESGHTAPRLPNLIRPPIG